MRVYESDDYDPLAAGRWERNLAQSIKGKRGQAALRAIHTALVNLPSKRLIADTFHTPDGDYCMVAAWAAGNGVDMPEWLNGSEDRWGHLPPDELEILAWATGVLNISVTLAWQLLWINDDNYWGQRVETDEERYERVMGWVEARIKVGAT